MGTRIMRAVAPCILLLPFACPWARAQGAPPRLELFAEGGGSFLTNGTGQILVACPVCTGPVCPLYVCAPTSPGRVTSSFSKTGRLFSGARFRFTRRDAIEASYSYSPNHFSLQEGTQPLGSAYNRDELISFNYVRYLSAGTRVQPFATAGLGDQSLQRTGVCLGGCLGLGQGGQRLPVRLELRRRGRRRAATAHCLAAGTQGLRDRAARLHRRDQPQCCSQCGDCLQVQVRIGAPAGAEGRLLGRRARAAPAGAVQPRT